MAGPPAPDDLLLAGLRAIHRELEASFTLLRELVVVGDGPRARAVLVAHQALTDRHATDEELLLVPHLPANARWPAALYTGQHGKLLAGLDRLAGALVSLSAGAPGWRARALHALDTAAPVHHLLEHHHLAEEQALFPSVIAAAPDAVARVLAAWEAARGAHAPVLAEARAHLGA